MRYLVALIIGLALVLSLIALSPQPDLEAAQSAMRPIILLMGVCIGWLIGAIVQERWHERRGE